MSVRKQSVPCELIINVGSNEYDEISTAIFSLFRRCSIVDNDFIVVENQIQPTSYFGTFTSPASIARPPIQCQSLSCVILLAEDRLLTKNDCFKSTDLWRFHHKIELMNERKQVIARQDYYELSHLLPLWSVSRVPRNRQMIVRFNIFTSRFESMLTFYTRLFQRPPTSSKLGFVLFVLPSQDSLIYQFSIKYSSSIQPYTISQAAHLKFRLNDLNDFIHDYSSKLFTINPSEYYIYDPDGNLLHLQLCQMPSRATRRESIPLKRSVPVLDSGIGDTSDPSTQLFSSNKIVERKFLRPIHPDVDNQSHSSNDSGRWSSVSSNEHKAHGRTVHSASMKCVPTPFFLSTARPNLYPSKPSTYDSTPRLSTVKQVDNRNYSSMCDVQRPRQEIRPRSTVPFQSKPFQCKNNDYDDLSYDVDVPPVHPTNSLLHTASHGYLHAFLEKKRREQRRAIGEVNVKQLIAQFERSDIMRNSLRPLSAPTNDHQPTTFPSQSIYNSLMPPIYRPEVSNVKLAMQRYESDEEDEEEETPSFSHDDDDQEEKDRMQRSPRINIGITLDSRLRKTPVLDMLRSTEMESPPADATTLNRSNSFRSPSVCVARF